MVTLAVCDNETIFRKNIVSVCRSYFEEKGIDYQIREYASGEAFLVECYPDILVLDIRMQKLSGILVKEILSKMQAETRILFVAENKNYVTEAFGKNVYGYLIKPLKYDLFSEKMDEIVGDIREQEKYVFCKNEGKFQKVYYKKILYIEAFGKISKIYVQGQENHHLSEMSIGQWEEMLQVHNFVRCSKRHIANLLYVTSVNRNVELLNQIKLPLGAAYKKEFMEKYKKGYCK